MTAALAHPLPPGTSDGGVIASYPDGAGGLLYYRVLEAAPEKHRLIYLHGLESHGAWFLPVARRLCEQGVTCFLLDRRGSGLNRAVLPGDAKSARELLDDARRFRAQVARGPVHFAGLSFGGKLQVAVALDDPDRVASLALIAPGLRARVGLSAWTKARFLAGLVTGGRNYLPIPIHDEMFTHDPVWLDYIRRDPLRVRRATGRMLLTSLALDRMIARRIGELAVPVLLALPEHDAIVDSEFAERLLARARSRVNVVRFKGAEHALQFERPAELAAAMVAHVAEHEP